MTRTEIARRLHDAVDRWHDSTLPDEFGEGVHMLVKLTIRHQDNPDDAITLVVGTEPAAEPDPPDDGGP